MEPFEPRATFLGGKYRLDRLVADDDGVTIWEATDVQRGLSVRLSVHHRSSTVIDHGRVDGGMFVVVDAPPRKEARLELVEISDEEAFFDESPAAELFDVEDDAPRPPTRRGRWAAGAALCATLALGGWYVARARPAPASVTTITAAQLPAPVIATPEPTATATAIPVVEHERPEAPRVARPTPKRHVPTTRMAPRRKARPRATDPLTL